MKQDCDVIENNYVLFVLVQRQITLQLEGVK